MVVISALPSTGFRKNLTHPFSSARSRTAGSRFAVVTMIGGAVPAARSRSLQLDARHAGELHVDDDAQRRR